MEVELADALWEMIATHTTDLVVARQLNKQLREYTETRFRTHAVGCLIRRRYSAKYRDRMEKMGLIAFTRSHHWPNWTYHDVILDDQQVLTNYTNVYRRIVHLTEMSVLENLILKHVAVQ